MKRGKNLIPLTQRDPEEAHAIRVKGGKARGKQRRERKTFAELLSVALSLEVTNEKTGEKRSMKDVGMLNLAKRVQAGDLSAIKLAAELLGEYKQNVNVESESRDVVVMVRDDGTAEKLNSILNHGDDKDVQQAD